MSDRITAAEIAEVKRLARMNVFDAFPGQGDFWKDIAAAAEAMPSDPICDALARKVRRDENGLLKRN